MLLLYTFVLILSFVKGEPAQRCLDEMNRRELRDFIREQEVITSIPTGRIVLQLMEKYKVEKVGKTKDQLRKKLEREVLTYKVLMKKSMKHFLFSESLGIMPDTLTRFTFFLIERDCLIPFPVREGLRENFSQYWGNQNWTERFLIMEEIKQKIITTSETCNK